MLDDSTVLPLLGCLLVPLKQGPLAAAASGTGVEDRWGAILGGFEPPAQDVYSNVTPTARPFHAPVGNADPSYRCSEFLR